jgi:microcystin-dependent protein
MGWQHLDPEGNPVGVEENPNNPPGMVVQFAGSVAPTGWLLCDGSAVSRVAYPALFTAIGTTYGAGDGSTTFNLPNLKGRVPVGRDVAQGSFDTIGETGGETGVTLTTAQMPSHNHGINDPSHSHIQHASTLYHTGSNQYAGSAGAGIQVATVGTSGAFTGITIQNNGSDQAHNNLQPYIVMNYIIRAG